MKWSEIEGQDRFIAEKIMGWQEDRDSLVGGYAHWPADYTQDLEAALQVAEKAQEKLHNSMFYITLERHRHDPYEVHFLYPVTVQEEIFSHVEDKDIRENCNLNELAETICYVVCQALGLVENENLED